MVGQVVQVENGSLQFVDAGGCSMGWMRYFPHDVYANTPATALTPEMFAAAEKVGGTYSGMGYRKAWLASIKVPSQSRMRAALEAAGYQLLGTSDAAHDVEHMELWGKGFTLPVASQVEGPAQRLKSRTRVLRRPHRAARAA